MRVSTGRSELELNVWGEGDPALTIHGVFTPYAFDAMSLEPLLCDQFRRIAYHRHNYGLSSHGDHAHSVKDEAEDALEVLQQVGGRRGHIVAHSGGAPKALQLALDHPDAVLSLTLIEPVLPTPEFREFHGRISGDVAEAYASGDRDRAARIFISADFGRDDVREQLDPVMPPDWWDHCVTDIG